jgi:ankyrin repeat protein
LNEANIILFRQLALDADVDVNCINNSNGFTPLLLVCSSNRSDSLFDCINSLLERNTINVNAKDQGGWGVVSFVCLFNGNNRKLPDIIKMLLENGIEMCTATTQGWSALSQAVLNLSYYHCNHPELITIVHKILERGINALDTSIGDKFDRIRILREKLIFVDLGFINYDAMVDLLEEYHSMVST